MQLETRHFGIIEINPDTIISFPEGIPGFESQKEFVVLEHDDSEPFKWLQSIDDTNLAFVIVDPRLIKPDYIVEIEDDKVSVLNIDNIDEVIIYSIVVVTEDSANMTANLRAPILINLENKTGKQILMDNDNYDIKYYFMKDKTDKEG